MNKKVFGKKYECHNSIINFSYTTFVDDDKVNISEEGMLLDNIFNDFYSSDILDVVQAIRTVFKKYEEDSLTVYFIRDNTKICAWFSKTELMSYFETKEFDNSEKVIFRYTEGKELDFSIKRKHYSSSVFKTTDLTEAFNQFMLTIDGFKNLSVIKLDSKDELICKVYKLFFDEDPDFSKKDTNVKIQTMITILCEFNICIDYPMSVYTEGKMPINYTLSDRIRKLRPLGKVDTSKLITVKLNKESEKDIKEIGKIVRESNIDMVTLSKIIHAGNYSLSDNSNTDYILNSTKCTNEEVEKGIAFIKKINKSLEENI